MVFYYSATGNSYWAAKSIADGLGERPVSVTDALKSGGPLRYALAPDEALGFVFPVHAWNPPQALLGFIARMELDGFDGQYVFGLATCGDTAGDTKRVVARALAKKGLPLDAHWELVMPNNYLPMYDVDSAGLTQAKLAQAEKDVAEIKQLVQEREADTRLLRGRLPALKTSVAGALFRRYAIRIRPFYATDACISCGRCARLCPTGTIRMAGKPEWSGGCDHCCACINRCPTQAIQYGKATESRGRYCHPILRGVRIS